MWCFTMTCLLLDLMATLLIASRDLQEGAVVAFGVSASVSPRDRVGPLTPNFDPDHLHHASPARVPVPHVRVEPDESAVAPRSLVSSELVREAKIVALTRRNVSVETKYAENCSTWLTSHKYMMMIPSALSCALHIIILGFASWYIRHREPTSAALLLDDELEYLDIARKRKEDKKKAKAAKKEQKRKAKEAKEKSRKKRGPTYVWRSGSSGGESDASDPNAPFRDEKKRDQGSNPFSGTVHTDSEEDQVPEPVDLEKQTLPSRFSQSTRTEGELGRRKRRTSRPSRRSSRG